MNSFRVRARGFVVLFCGLISCWSGIPSALALGIGVINWNLCWSTFNRFSLSPYLNLFRFLQWFSVCNSKNGGTMIKISPSSGSVGRLWDHQWALCASGLPSLIDQPYSLLFGFSGRAFRWLIETWEPAIKLLRSNECAPSPPRKWLVTVRVWIFFYLCTKSAA